MRVARRFLLSGRVQGVGFRWFVQELAVREGAAGWVRNRPDGRVEALLQGEAEAVLRAERQIRRGPPASTVADVQAFDEPVSDRLRAFEIRTTLTTFAPSSLTDEE
jgi:acylphosphatase